MTIDELKAKLPPAMQDAATQYGPAILKMTAADTQSWLNYVFVGKYTEAYALYLKNAGEADLLAEFDKSHAEWTSLNEANADRIALQKKIAQAFASIMLTVLLAAVGL